MLKLLTKLFIKNYDNIDDPKVRASYGKLGGIVGIISNIILCSIKIITGFLMGSISMIADGINNLADAGSSAITLIGFKLASAPADSEHPFGHQRIEYITGLIISFIILFIGATLCKTSIEKIISGEGNTWNSTTKYIMIGILSIAILIKLWQSRFNAKLGKKINSVALIATSVDSLNDCISTGAVLLSVIVSLIFPSLQLDAYMGIVVSAYIIYSGIQLIKETMSPLIGEAPTSEEIHFISENILKYDGVLGIHDLVIHSYGPGKVFITVHVEVDAKVDVTTSHDMIDNIEMEFLDKHNMNLVIHMDPVDLSCSKTMDLRLLISDVLAEIDPSLRFHDFRAVIGNTHTNVLFDVVVPPRYKLNDEELKNLISKKVNQIDSTLILKITIDQEMIGRKV